MSTETELTISRLIKAPPAVVWNAWSVPENLAKWWIPAPIECRVDTLDLHPGGGFVTKMREDGGEWQAHVDGCFLEAVPERKLVFTTVLTEGWQPVEPWLALTAILTFEPQDGGTLYAARVLHKSAEDSAKHDEMGFYEGWGTAIGQLARLVER
ncbi:SRPBCC family protein [Sphingopyxis sp.]|uniref:SRPBCC family protein n=1 Tax=Sphingopyxis sp. TaxID=1908224 RepID=UPI003D0CFAA3